MSVALSTGVKNAMLNQIRDLMDIGSGPAIIRIYSGTQPSPGASPSGGNVLLAEISFNDPSAPNASNGELSFDISGMSTTGIADGTAVWARIVSSSGFFVVDLTVGELSSGEPVELSDTGVTVGATISIGIARVTFNS